MGSELAASITHNGVVVQRFITCRKPESSINRCLALIRLPEVARPQATHPDSEIVLIVAERYKFG